MLPPIDIDSMDLKQYMLDKKAYLRLILPDVKPRSIRIAPSKSIITSIIGPRRAGKTYLFYSFIKENALNDDEYLLVNFEDAEIGALGSEEILKSVLYHEELYGVQPKYIFFDEVQSFNDWEKIVYTLYERKLYAIVLTGSSSKLLSKEIATQLRGRSLPVLVLPLSFAEFLRAKGIEYGRNVDSMTASRIKKALSEYLAKGGFPDIALQNAEETKFFKEYVDVLLFKDVVERGRIRNINVAKFMINAIAASYAKGFSLNKNYLMLKSSGINVSKKTLYNYFLYFEDAFFSFAVQKFDFSIKKSYLASKKVYLNDTGLAHYFATQSKELGKLAENAVFLQLARQKEHADKMEIGYWKDAYGGEVDFVIKNDSKVAELIQVTSVSDPKEIKEREVSGLAKAQERLKCSKLTIITWDYEGEIDARGTTAKCVPLWKWLLQ